MFASDFPVIFSRNNEKLKKKKVKVLIRYFVQRNNKKNAQISGYFLTGIQCQHCGQSFPMDEYLVLLHTKTCQFAARPDTSYKHVCCKCSYHTKYFADMRRHLRKHSGNRPYKCNFCDHRTSTNGNLLSHMRIIHEKTQI